MAQEDVNRTTRATLDEIAADSEWEGPPPEGKDSVEWLRYAAHTALSLKYDCEPQISVNQLNAAADEIEHLRQYADHTASCPASKGVTKSGIAVPHGSDALPCECGFRKTP